MALWSNVRTNDIWDFGGFFDWYESPRNWSHVKTRRLDDGHQEFSIDVPGVKKEDLVVKVKQDILYVDWKRDGKECSRVYTISEQFDPTSLRARLADGVLTVTLSPLRDASERIVEVE